MQNAIPTIRAKRKSDGFEAVINVSDFDPELWDAVDKKSAASALAAKSELEQAAAAEEANNAQREVNAAARKKHGTKKAGD